MSVFYSYGWEKLRTGVTRTRRAYLPPLKELAFLKHFFVQQVDEIKVMIIINEGFGFKMLH